MKTTFTPGPWHIGMKPEPMIYGPNGEQVADMRHKPFTLVSEIDESVANVRLVAAAPDLLAALESVTLAIEQLVDIKQGSPVAFSVRKARAAIAKARGEL